MMSGDQAQVVLITGTSSGFGELISKTLAAASVVNRPPVQPGPGYQLPDPQEVADAIKRLIGTPAGERPLRTVVGPIFTEGVPEYNEEYERTKRRLANVLGRPDQAVTWGRPAR